MLNCRGVQVSFQSFLVATKKEIDRTKNVIKKIIFQFFLVATVWVERKLNAADLQIVYLSVLSGCYLEDELIDSHLPPSPYHLSVLSGCYIFTSHLWISLPQIKSRLSVLSGCYTRRDKHTPPADYSGHKCFQFFLVAT